MNEIINLTDREAERKERLEPLISSLIGRERLAKDFIRRLAELGFDSFDTERVDFGDKAHILKAPGDNVCFLFFARKGNNKPSPDAS